MRKGGSGFEEKIERRKKKRENKKFERDRKFVFTALCEL